MEIVVKMVVVILVVMLVVVVVVVAVVIVVIQGAGEMVCILSAVEVVHGCSQNA